MSKSISGEMLSKEIMKALEGYADDISDIVEVIKADDDSAPESQNEKQEDKVNG